ncbi:MAG: (2Fe-2S) ferredoxin domain-containing protein [Thermodesulfobacteriota bacterium]
MPKLSIEDLKRIKEREMARMTLREGQHRAKIVVHMGTCGIAAGARKVMEAFLESVAESGAMDVVVTQSGCAGLCNREPMATVEIVEKAPVKYVDLDPEKARRIFREHVQGGRVVEDYALGRGSESTAG